MIKKKAKVRVSWKSAVIDLTLFTAKETKPGFIVILNIFAVKSLVEKMGRINYSDSGF